jgi:glyoxylase-like metal-dependent hydrolase (beta-lactamase superfamily II)
MCYLADNLAEGDPQVRLDRVADDIFIFVSGFYAQVTATVLVTPQGAIVVDTMPLPSETRQILFFIESRLGPNAVRYVINSHHHADHVYGTYLFGGAEVIAHDGCRDVLERLGQASLEQAKRNVPALAEVELRLPDITLQKEMHIHLGHRNLHVFHTPGHTADSVSVFVVEEKVLIAGDTVMPVPHIVTGDCAQLSESLNALKALKPAFIVQGHGDVLLRGEVDEELDGSIAYLATIVKKVSQIVQRGDPPQRLRDIDIESCGKSRIPLDGLVSKLHLDNLASLYRSLERK